MHLYKGKGGATRYTAVKEHLGRLPKAHVEVSYCTGKQKEFKGALSS